MCLQDLRITQGLTLRIISTTSDANARAFIGGLRRMVLMFGVTTGGTARMAFIDTGGSNRDLPWDTRYGTDDLNRPIYTRESIGPFAYMPLFVRCAGAGETVTVYVYEYDAPTDAAVNTLFGGM